MKKIILTSFLTGLMFLFASHAQAVLSNSVSDDLAGLLDSFHSLSANFNQLIYDSNNQVIRKSTGSMALSRPGKFRWEVKQPTPQLLIADGHYLWIYDIDLSQATRQVLDKSKTDTPASLLSGSVPDLKKRFNVTHLEQKPGDTFRLVPKNEGDLFQWIELTFIDKKLVRMRLYDNLGSLSVFQFSAVQINLSFNKDFFQFSAPKDVDVIHSVH